MNLRPAVHVWDTVTQQQLLGLRSEGAFTGWTEFSPDGNTVLALSWHGLAELWRAPTWEAIAAMEQSEVLPPNPGIASREAP